MLLLLKRLRAGREIHSMKGVVNTIMEMNTGSMKLGHGASQMNGKGAWAERMHTERSLYYLSIPTTYGMKYWCSVGPLTANS